MNARMLNRPAARTALLAALLGVATAGSARADELADAIRKLHARIGPALVGVKLTFESDDGERREFELPGLVIAPDGLTMVPAPDRMQQQPRAFFRKFEMFRTERYDDPIPCKLVAFDSIAELGFVAPAKPETSAVYLDLLSAAPPPELGQPLICFGMLPESLGRRCAFELTRGGPLVAEDKLVVTPWPTTFPATAVVTMEGAFVATTNLESRVRIQGTPTVRMASSLLPAVKYVLASRKDRPEPWLGLAGLVAASKDIREFYELPAGRAAIVVGHVVEGYPAEKSGLMAKDLIIGLNDKMLTIGATEDETTTAFTQAIKKCDVGQPVKLIVWRDKREVPLTTQVGEMPMTPAKAERTFNKDIGLAVRQLVFQDTFDRKLPNDQKGVIADRLVQAGPADSGGMQAGDIVRKVQDEPIDTIKDYQRVIEKALADKPKEVVLSVLRGTSENVVIRIEMGRAAAEKPARRPGKPARPAEQP